MSSSTFTAPHMRASAVPEWLRLVAAVAQAHDDGRRTPCLRDPAPYLSDDYRERREAANACVGCSVLDECAAYADVAGERHHVWGGRDRGPRSKGPRGAA